MATQIYLGNPPENIKKWIIDNYVEPEVDMLKVPLHFTANEPGSTIKLIAFDDPNWGFCESWCELQYSTDGMKTWKDYPKAANAEQAKIKLDDCENQTIYFQAKYGNTEDNPNLNGFAYYDEYERCLTKWHYFVMEGSIKANGNIQFLLENSGTKMNVPPHCYEGLFVNYIDDMANSALTQAPILPATTLAEDCYSQMFYWCTSLTQAPELPATTLAERCYRAMFSQCTSLTQAPELPATTLAEKCYSTMFDYCTSLTKAPELPATTLASNCYSYMFSNCMSLTKAPELPATTLADWCYDNMFSSCKSPFTFSDKTFDEVTSLIQNKMLIGESCWFYYDEDYNEIIIDPVEIICSDKTMLVTFDEDKWEWTITEK